MQEPTPDTPTQPEPMSLMARLTGIFVTPGEVFNSLKTSPPSPANWLVPAVIFLLVSWVGATLVFSNPAVTQQIQDMQEQAIQKQVASGKITQQQADQILQMTGKYAAIGAKIGGYAGPVFVAFASPFGNGLLLWLGGLIFRRRLAYMQAVEAVGLSNVLSILESLAQWLLMMAMGSMFVSLSPVLFLKDLDPTGPLFGLLSLLGFIGLWCLAVRAIALSRLSGLSMGLSALWVFGCYFLMGGMGIAAGQLGQMMGGR